jgi:peptide/nickel transport system substrate-binding protein
MRYYFFFFIAVLAICPGCKKGKNANLQTGTFYFNLNAGVSSLDPAFAKNQNNMWVVNQLYNGLLQFDEDLNIQPCIAKRWITHDNGKIYEIHLRKDVYYVDNQCFEDSVRRVTASDFVYSFNRLINPETASPGSWIFNGKVADSLPFYATDDTTLFIRLKEPFRPMLGILTMQYCSVVPHEAVEFYGKSFRENPVGTGPFVLEKWDEQEVMVMRKNKNYFESTPGHQMPILDKVVISFIENKGTEFLYFLDGYLDFVSDIDPGLKELVLNHDGGLNPKYAGQIDLVRSPFLNTEYLGFNAEIIPDGLNPIQMKWVRKAINYGFDRKGMIRFLRNNKGMAANKGMIPPGLPAFDANAGYGYTFQPDSTRKYLAKAGFPGGKGLPAIVLYAPTTYMDICEYIQHQLGNAGIQLDIEITQSGILRSRMESGKAGFFRASWIADYPDAESYMALFYSGYGAPPNYTHYKNTELDKLYQKAIQEENDAARYALYRQMDSIVMDDAIVVPLYYDEVYRFKHNNVEGLGSNAMNLLTLKNVSKK